MVYYGYRFGLESSLNPQETPHLRVRARMIPTGPGLRPLLSLGLIDSLYSRAERMGADAITQFESEIVTREESNVTRIGVEASGFAINRVDN